MLKRTLPVLLKISVELIAMLDSRDLCTLLATQCQTADRLAYADLIVIYCYFGVCSTD